MNVTQPGEAEETRHLNAGSRTELWDRKGTLVGTWYDPNEVRGLVNTVEPMLISQL